jgi:hypothetical protein
VFGALPPATGAAFAATYERRTAANWVDSLGQVESWVGPTAERVYAVVDNLNIHGGMDVLGSRHRTGGKARFPCYCTFGPTYTGERLS